jgi:hypothetical protein
MQIENDAKPGGLIETLQELAAGGKPLNLESVALQEYLGGVPHVIIVVHDTDNPTSAKRHLTLPKEDA